MAVAQFRNDRFRTGLSLAGIAIGIFSTVAALTLVDSLGRCMNDGLSDFGRDLVMIEQIPLEPELDEEDGFRWWDYATRPPVTREEYLFLAAHSTLTANICCGRTLKRCGRGGGWGGICTETSGRKEPVD